MSGLGCVIPSNCCSMTVGCAWARVSDRGGSARRRGSVSVCMTRGCIRGAGIESLERRGRAGVTNQLWESRLDKTHPLFSPQREREGTDKTKLFRPKPLQMNGYHQKYQEGSGHPFLTSSFLSFFFYILTPLHPGSNKCEGYCRKCIRLGGYLSRPCAHPSTDG